VSIPAQGSPAGHGEGQPEGPAATPDADRNAGPLPGDVLLTAAEAAVEVGVRPATLRQWVHLGRLAPAGKRGRAHVFWLADVFAAERGRAFGDSAADLPICDTGPNTSQLMQRQRCVASPLDRAHD